MTTTPQTAAAFEADLPVVDALDQIDHFRIITKSGESRKATPAQVRELCGIDYSILTEQAVPGEYWLNAKGVKKQVYTITVRQTTKPILYAPENRGLWSLDPIANRVSSIVSTTGFIDIDGGEKLALIPFKDLLVYYEVTTEGKIVVGGRIALASVGKNITIIVTIKYTK